MEAYDVKTDNVYEGIQTEHTSCSILQREEYRAHRIEDCIVKWSGVHFSSDCRCVAGIYFFVEFL